MKLIQVIKEQNCLTPLNQTGRCASIRYIDDAMNTIQTLGKTAESRHSVMIETPEKKVHLIHIKFEDAQNKE